MNKNEIIFTHDHDKMIVEGLEFTVNVRAGEIVPCDQNGYVHIFAYNDDDAGTISIKASSLVDSGYAVHKDEKELHLKRIEPGKFEVKG